MAARARLITRDSRWLRHLSKHERVSAAGVVSGAAAAVLENAERGQLALGAIHAGQWVFDAERRHAEHICRRSRLPGGICSELANVGTARFARIADRHRHLSRLEGQSLDAGVSAEYVSVRRDQPMPVVPERFRVPD